MPLPFTRCRLPDCVPGLQPQRDPRPVERGHVDLAAQRGLGERDRHPHGEVVAVAAEQRVRRDVALDDQVAGRAAVAARRAAALEADPLPIGDARGDARLHLARAALDAGAAAAWGTARSMMTPAPPHARHGDENEKKPWLSSTTPRPPHCEHTFGCVPGLAPLPLQVLHCASLVRCSVVVRPLAASTKSSVSVASTSAPRCGPAAADAPPPRRPRLNICPSRSPKPSAPTLKL